MKPFDHEHAQVGDRLARYEATPLLRWFQPNGASVARLQQWWEAIAYDDNGARHSRGEWRPVPTEHT